MVNQKERGERLLGDLDTLVDRVGAAVRDAVNEGELAEDIDALVDKVSEAVRDAISKDRLADDADALAERVAEAVREAISENRPKGMSIPSSTRSTERSGPPLAADRRLPRACERESSSCWRVSGGPVETAS